MGTVTTDHRDSLTNLIDVVLRRTTDVDDMSCRHARRSRYEPLHPSGIVASKSSQVRSSRGSQRSGWGGELSVVGVRHGHPETQSRPPARSSVIRNAGLIIDDDDNDDNDTCHVPDATRGGRESDLPQGLRGRAGSSRITLHASPLTNNRQRAPMGRGKGRTATFKYSFWPLTGDAERAPATGDRQSDLGASLGRRDRRAITRSSQHHAREATRGNRAKYLLPPTATREPGCVGASGVAAGTEKKRPSRLFGARWTNEY